MEIAIGGCVIVPKEFSDGEAGVEGDVKCRRLVRIGRRAIVIENSVVVNHLGGVHVGPVPGRRDGFWDDAVEGGGGRAEAGVGDGGTEGFPWV